jgi:ketosteroid isomerase-like protein
MSQENAEIVRRGLEASYRRPPDWATVRELYHADHEFIPLLSRVEGRSYVGLDGALEWGAQMAATGPSETRLREVRAAPDGRVVALSTVWWLATRSGIAMEREIGTVVTLRDGRIARTEIFPTPAEALEVAGLAD